MGNNVDGPFLVTGASGLLGRRVLELMLEARDGPLIATTRSPDKLTRFAERGVEVRSADFNEPAGLVDAFSGAKRLLLISTDDLEAGKRLEAHRNAIDAAIAAGVEHIVYTSLINPAPDSPISFSGDHSGTEALLAESGVNHTNLRNSLYSDMLLLSAPQAVGMGQLMAAAADGAASYVTREDCARAAAAALATETETQTYDITGPEAASHEMLAQVLSEVTGRNISYVPISVEDLRAAMIGNGLPDMMADVFSGIDVAIAQGYFSTTSDAVEQLTGKAPMSVREFLANHKDALVGSGS